MLAVRLGRRFLDNAQDAPPRLVWIPTTMQFGHSPFVGGDPRQLATRVQRVEAHCWHNDFAQCEWLTSVAQAAIHRAAPGAYELVDGVCMSDQGADVNLRGYVIAFSFDVRIPVLDRAHGTALITATEFDFTQALQGDMVLEAGEEENV